MPDLQFLKTLIFARALWKSQNSVNFTIFSYLRFFPDRNVIETQTQPKITPKTTKNLGSLMQYFASKQLPVQILWKIRF